MRIQLPAAAAAAATLIFILSFSSCFACNISHLALNPAYLPAPNSFILSFSSSLLSLQSLSHLSALSVRLPFLLFFPRPGSCVSDRVRLHSWWRQNDKVGGINPATTGPKEFLCVGFVRNNPTRHSPHPIHPRRAWKPDFYSIYFQISASFAPPTLFGSLRFRPECTNPEEKP